MRADQPSVSLVVPIYNEVENVVPLLAEIESALAGLAFEVLLVDDGSTDGSGERIPQNLPWLRVISFPEHRGQSAALFAGIMDSSAPVIVTMDGDLQLDAEDIPPLLARLTPEIDLVCGYRLGRRDTWSKRLQSALANAIRRLVIRDGIRDTGCGLKAMRHECRDVLVEFDGMHRYLAAMVRQAGFRVAECPVRHRARVHGHSKYGFHNRAWRGLIDLFGVSWLLARRRRAVVRTVGKGHLTD